MPKTEELYAEPFNVDEEIKGFSAGEYAERIKKTRKKMAKRGFDALCITSPENIYYLAGLNHQGYFAFTMLILTMSGRPVLITRSMERITVTHQAPDVTHVGFGDGENPSDAVATALGELGLSRGTIGIEKENMFFPPLLWEQIQTAAKKVKWQDASGIVDKLRLIKSPREIRCIRAAAAISDKAVEKGIQMAAEGVSEQSIAAAVMETLIDLGSEPPGFSPLIRSTKTLPHEHTTWSDYVLQKEDILFTELSASVLRYHAPLIRMVYIEKASDDIRRASEIALEGLYTVRDNLKPGVTTGSVYAAWQKVVNKHLGHSKFKRHHCGYTVGIGFPPSWVGGSTVKGITRGGKTRIKEGMTFHVLSWLAGAGLGEFVISDTMVVTENGAEILTSVPRDLIIK